MNALILHDARGRAYGIRLSHRNKPAGLRRIPAKDVPAGSVPSAFPYRLPVRYQHRSCYAGRGRLLENK